MLDPIALLQSLTLPAGALTGQRIVLDGTTGLIDIFDAAGLLRIELGQTDGIRLFTGDASENVSGHLTAVVVGAGASRRLALVLDSPQFLGQLFPTISLDSESFDGTVPTTIELVADVLALTGLAGAAPTLQWAVDTNLYRASANVLKTDDTFNAVTDVQVAGVSLPRGVMGTPFDATANDAARAAGVNTDMAVTFTADATRLYEVTVKVQFNVGTAAAVYALELVEGGTVGANDGTGIDRFQRWSAADTPAGSLTLHCDSTMQYRPTAGSKTVRVANDAGSGGTVTMVGAATIRRQLSVKDIGLR